MSLKQHVHDDKPESLLGKSCEDGTGNEVYVLGERSQTDIPDIIDTEKIKRIKMVFIIFLVNLQTIMTIMIFLVSKLFKKILIRMRIINRQGPKDDQLLRQHCVLQVGPLTFSALHPLIVLRPNLYLLFQQMSVGRYLGRPAPSSTVHQLKQYCALQVGPLTFSALHPLIVRWRLLLTMVSVHRCQCLLCSQYILSTISKITLKLGKTERIFRISFPKIPIATTNGKLET